MSNDLTIDDRAVILKFADECADNKDGFGFAFYNASIVRFAIGIYRLRADRKKIVMQRAIDAWDTTTHQKNGDGRLWQCMEELRMEITK